MPKRRRTIDETRAIAADHLSAIGSLFVPGVKLTLLVRQPAAPDGSQDFCLTDDDLTAALDALRIRKEAS